MGTSNTNHDLTIQIGRDYLATFETTKTFPAGSDVTLPGPLETVRLTHLTQKVQAVRYKISDAAPADPALLGTGQGPTLEGLGILAQGKTGLPRRPATKKAG